VSQFTLFASHSRAARQSASASSVGDAVRPRRGGEDDIAPLHSTKFALSPAAPLASIGHTAAPPSSVMNSRRFITTIDLLSFEPLADAQSTARPPPQSNRGGWDLG
jgi:hypothetical protein